MRYLSEWMALRETLLTRPEEVLPLLSEFEEATQAYEPVKQLFYFSTWYSKDTEMDFYEKRARLIQAEQSMYRAIYP